MSEDFAPKGEPTGDANEADFQQWGDEVGTPPADASAAVAGDELADARKQLAERTEDLQRIQAEYVNYKRRVDRDRDLARHGGIEAVVHDLLPVLDAIEQARQHDELSGGFKLVADELEKVAAKYGLEAYGEVGDTFDPNLHEALMAAPSEPGQTEAKAAMVMQRGYKLKDRIVRYARVAVSEADPGASSGDAPSS